MILMDIEKETTVQDEQLNNEEYLELFIGDIVGTVSLSGVIII
jgi:hypothetical protein